MTTPYAQALATPGAPRFVAAAFVGRLPIAMATAAVIAASVTLAGRRTLIGTGRLCSAGDT